MRRPDIARAELGPLATPDLRFLLENMPRPGADYREIAELLEAMPSTLESMLTSDCIYQLLRDRRHLLLDISPFLLFSVLLRRSLGRPRSGPERRVINYLANMLALFIRTERLYRIEPADPEPHEYVWELVASACEAADPRRQFLTFAHIGNYALWLTGLHAPWLRHRHRTGRRPVSPSYYAEAGQAYFDRAARHRLAGEFGLDDVFRRLALMFPHYQAGLARMRRDSFAA